MWDVAQKPRAPVRPARPAPARQAAHNRPPSRLGRGRGFPAVHAAPLAAGFRDPHHHWQVMDFLPQREKSPTTITVSPLLHPPPLPCPHPPRHPPPHFSP